MVEPRAFACGQDTGRGSSRPVVRRDYNTVACKRRQLAKARRVHLSTRDNFTSSASTPGSSREAVDPCHHVFRHCRRHARRIQPALRHTGAKRGKASVCRREPADALNRETSCDQEIDAPFRREPARADRARNRHEPHRRSGDGDQDVTVALVKDQRLARFRNLPLLSG